MLHQVGRSPARMCAGTFFEIPAHPPAGAEVVIHVIQPSTFRIPRSTLIGRRLRIASPNKPRPTSASEAGSGTDCLRAPAMVTSSGRVRYANLTVPLAELVASQK